MNHACKKDSESYLPGRLLTWCYDYFEKHNIMCWIDVTGGWVSKHRFLFFVIQTYIELIFKQIKKLPTKNPSQAQLTRSCICTDGNLVRYRIEWARINLWITADQWSKSLCIICGINQSARRGLACDEAITFPFVLARLVFAAGLLAICA